MLKKQGLYDPQFEHDSCGVGFVVNVSGTRTHQIVSDGVTILKNLVHRGAVGGDLKTGDGAGMLTQLPHEFMRKVCTPAGISLPESGAYGVGMLFLPLESDARAKAVALTEKAVADEGGTVLGWRDVPVNPDCLGEMARENMPDIRQLFVTFDGLTGDAIESKLYVLRKE